MFVKNARRTSRESRTDGAGRAVRHGIDGEFDLSSASDLVRRESVPNSFVRRQRIGIDVIRWSLTRVALVGVAILIVFGIMAKLDAQTSGSIPTAQHTYIVKPGDTVFSIAQRFDHGGNIETYEYRILQSLGGATTIYPGEEISLPSLS
ncbi:MAG: LysM peptidoglycan-binding domain-containing protein [Acidimicrobiales bacterium]